MNDPKTEQDAAKLFSVPDFVGDACKAIASRIRGNVAASQFDDFHKVGRLFGKSILVISRRRSRLRRFRIPLASSGWPCSVWTRT